MDARTHGGTALAVAAALRDDAGRRRRLTTLGSAEGVGVGALQRVDAHAGPRSRCARRGDRRDGASGRVRALSTRARRQRGTRRMEAARVIARRALRDAPRRGGGALVVNADGAGVLSQVAANVSRGTRSKVRAATREILLRAAPQLRVLLLHHEDCAGHVSVKPHQESDNVPILRRAGVAWPRARQPGRCPRTRRSCRRISSRHESNTWRGVTARSTYRSSPSSGECVANTPVAFTPCYQNLAMPAAKQKRPEFSDTFFSPGTMAAASSRGRSGTRGLYVC